MKKISALIASILVGACTPAVADPSVKGWNTYDSMGCMMLRECKDGVKEVKSLKDFEDHYPNSYYGSIRNEFSEILHTLHGLGIGVFLADSKYFVEQNRGVYHTSGNNVFLNEDYMDKGHTLMGVMRHEGWHIAQDCMGGEIKNNVIAIIHDEEDVPIWWEEQAKRTYPKESLPWEKEALWAGHTEMMTLNALKVCLAGNMWETYEPTPLTRAYLVKKGYIK